MTNNRHVWFGLVEDGGNERKTISKNDPTDSASDLAKAVIQREKAFQLLKEMASHLKGNTNILAIDSLNEPTGSYGNELQKKLYGGVRAGDANVPVILEHVDHLDTMALGWTNVILSNHNYPYPSTNMVQFKESVDNYVKYGYNVPFLVGEFHVEPKDITSAISMMEEKGMGWAIWSFKGFDIGNWTFVNLPAAARPNLASDSIQRIKSKWSQNWGNKFYSNAKINAFKAALRNPRG